ncbi:amino acid-binding ACT protein [Knoellia flava TL1]|uniref:ACT domain-containing protein n=2 Tax=Knoellia flava TaxID=913969 RepID=A0A8H9KTF2_9MICO|nr:ACT domain-containing protein [Knoellia flava]KGN32761.1 amino acid-binding ACT protein [Knoellia flava TL1]GGB87865.1 hypothetical protein GCM10011314_29600 [Knoellia flava]
MTTTLVLSVIGDDRAGLVKALADVIAANDGNWERSHLSELAGKFAGIVVVTVPDDRAGALREALAPLEGLLDVTVHGAADEATAADVGGQGTDEAPVRVRVELLGNDHPGIVGAVSGVLADHGLSVSELVTGTRPTPEAGGQLFDAVATATAPAGTDLPALQSALEELATEIMVDLTLDAPEPGEPA